MDDKKANHSEEYHTLKNGKEAKIVSGLDRPLKTTPIGEQTRAMRRQTGMVILANLGVVATGMVLASPTVMLGPLTNSNEPVHLTREQSSWFASINMLSCPLGGLLSSLLLDNVGRKNTIYVVNSLMLAAWITMAFSSHTNSEIFYWQLLASRFIAGISTGLSGAPSGVYAAEISRPKMRGRLILGTALSTAAGITLLYIIGYFIRDDFRLIAFICAGYQVIALLAVLPLPESHSWLLSKNRTEEAKKSLNYFRGLDKSPYITHPEVLEEFSILEKSLQLKDGEKKLSFFKSLRLPEVYKPLLILMGMFAFQQLTGIFVVIVYAVQIATEAGVSIDPFICAVFVGLARLVTTLPMGYILERWGRRRAGLRSATGMCICMMLLASHSWSQWLQAIPFLPAICMVAFILLSTLGLYTLPFFMVSELFPQKVRGPASGLTLAVGMFFAFVCIKSFPEAKAAIGSANCFLFFGFMAFLALIFVYFFLPETRRRTLLEIEEQFRSGNRRPKQISEVEMQEVFIR